MTLFTTTPALLAEYRQQHPDRDAKELACLDLPDGAQVAGRFFRQPSGQLTIVLHWLLSTHIRSSLPKEGS